MARHRGGLEVLLALGFVERRSVEDDELCLVLEEPPLELDLDAWSAWFETRSDRDWQIDRETHGLLQAQAQPLPPTPNSSPNPNPNQVRGAQGEA